MTRYLGIVLVCLLGCGRGASAQAQEDSQPTDALVNKFFDVVVLAGLGDEFPGTLIGAIAGQLSNYPVGTSSGGFTYEFETNLGIVRRSTRSFGPAFAERALTVGQRKLSVGFNFQRAKLDRFEGQDLTALALGTFGDSSTEMALNLTSETAALVVQAGVLRQLDVGVVLPMVRVHMDVAVRRRVGNQTRGSSAASGSSSGIGDVVLKAKYNFFRRGGGGVAAAVDLRLPTGDEHNLLGSGATRVKVIGIGSAEVGRFAPHVNLGVTSESSGQCGVTIAECYLGSLDKEFNFAGGVDVIASPQLTILADVIGRSIASTRRFGYFFGDSIFDYEGGRRLTTLLGSTGLKVNVGGTFLVTASVLFPLNRAGLSSHLATTVGFDYAF